MIVYGARNYLEFAGHAQSQLCNRCGTSREFKLYEQYRSFALYWVFGVVTEKKYLLLCEVCNVGTEIPKDQIQLYNVRQASIPFMRRFGLLVFVGAIVAISAWSIMLGSGTGG